MIHLMSQRDAERDHRPAAEIQNISPYVNPAHVLAPPRRWLEALVSGEYGWEFFRLRYKHLLRTRYKAEPERFQALLDASLGGQELVLTCHCLSDHCHRELARDFLERLRAQLPVEPMKPARRTAAPKSNARAPRAAMVLATLIEHPHAASSAHP